MTWSISASGTKEEVKQKIDQQVTGDNHASVRDALKLLVESFGGNAISVSGSGHSSETGGSASISISAWMKAEEPKPAADDTVPPAA